MRSQDTQCCPLRCFPPEPKHSGEDLEGSEFLDGFLRGGWATTVEKWQSNLIISPNAWNHCSDIIMTSWTFLITTLGFLPKINLFVWEWGHLVFHASYQVLLRNATRCLFVLSDFRLTQLMQHAIMPFHLLQDPTVGQKVSVVSISSIKS